MTRLRQVTAADLDHELMLNIAAKIDQDRPVRYETVDYHGRRVSQVLPTVALVVRLLAAERL